MDMERFNEELDRQIDSGKLTESTARGYRICMEQLISLLGVKETAKDIADAIRTLNGEKDAAQIENDRYFRINAQHT